MISSSRILPIDAGEPNDSSWPDNMASILSPGEFEAVRPALAFSQPLYAGKFLPTGEPLGEHITGTVGILARLRVDSDTLVAGVLHDVPRTLDRYEDELLAAFGAVVAHLVEGVFRMSRIRSLGKGNVVNAADQSGQVEALRKMLLAMAEDIRVVILALADRLQTIRYVATHDISGRSMVAHETLDIFAPLASRLGLWQIKWELEDLSFRVLEPEKYRQIAGLLEDTRVNRECYIALLVEKLRHELRQAGISAEVTGRPKHIYSIHKKMKRKGVDFGEIHDARAVRILVNDVKDCYAALGVVHNLWIPVPREFDDYIAKPKGNDYRSLHTAVTGPEDKVVEVQIRTHEMHRHSEMGVAAHWRYKEGAKRDAPYEEKIAWLRQILEWKNDVDDAGELAEHFRTALFQDTIYVLTPKGKIIALPKGATPVDFAYQLHTDLGHRCRGAKVDGVMVPLDYSLQNAKRVEIIAAKQGGPSRDWLNPLLGYLRTQRARQKVRQWFSSRERDFVAQGRAIAEKELQRHGMMSLALDKLAARFKFTKIETFFAALARGEVNSRQLEEALRTAPETVAPTVEVPKPVTAGSIRQPSGGVLIVGVDKLLTLLAKCCKPVPPDPIAGFVTRGRGITIHRRECASLARLVEKSGDRLVAAQWNAEKGISYPVDISIKALDRHGLLGDIAQVLSREKVNVIATRTQSRDATAILQFTVAISDIPQLRRILGLIKGVPDVVSAERR